jgi:predicted DNA-binding ArsR family transcriptional regulator
VNSIGEGALSLAQSALTAQEPYQVDIPQKKSASATHIEVKWTEPLNGGSPVRGYRVYKNGIMITDLGPEVLSLSISDNIAAGITYQVSVSAYNDVSEGPISDNLEIMAAMVPDAPTNVRMLSQSATSIQIEWDTPYDGGTPLTTYKVFSDLATGGASFTEIEASTGLVNSYEISSNINTDYVY